MDLFTSFFLSVLASVAAYYICKWLDGDEQLVASLGFKPPTQNGIEKPRRIAAPGLFACHHGHLHLFAYWHYSICLIAIQVYPLFLFSNSSALYQYISITIKQLQPMHCRKYLGYHGSACHMTHQTIPLYGHLFQGHQCRVQCLLVRKQQGAKDQPQSLLM